MQATSARLAVLLVLTLSTAVLVTGCASHVQRPVVTPNSVAPEAKAPGSSEPEAQATIPADDPALRLPYEPTRDKSLREPAVEITEELTASPLDTLAKVTPEIDPVALEAERAVAEATKPEFDIPMVTNDKVLFWLNYYTERRPGDFLPGLRRSGRYIPMFRKIFEEEGVPQDLVYMAHVESAYKPSAYSHAHAMGVWQFIASTARIYDLKINYWVDERRDPEKAARAAARYLKKLHGDFDDWYLAMAAYNGGEGRIGRALKRTGKKDFWSIANTRHIRKETKNYVPAILAAIQISKDPEKFGMGFEPDDEIKYDSVDIEGAVDLQVLADCSGSDFETLRKLNPSLRRQQTPPNATTQVRVPVGSGTKTLIALANVPQEERVLFVRHRVRRGDTLYDLARAYGVTVGAIQQANSMGRRTMINLGKELVIPTVAAGKFASSRPSGARPPSSVNTASNGRKVLYRVRRGDTLSGIARRFNTTVSVISATNGISRNRLLQIGQRLSITSGARSVAQARALSDSVAKAANGTYTVRRGDSLWAIANMFRTTVENLCALNGISKNGTLHPGTRLTVGP